MGKPVNQGSAIIGGNEAIAAIAFPLLAFLYLLSIPMNHDTAWLLEATRRWVEGGRLYVDIIEINPPLIFLENVLLSGGTLTKTGYLAGVAIVIVISALWSRKPLIVSATLTLAAINDFGQRDHLALIFLTPYLLVENRRHRFPLIAWAFLGMALKPHFLLMPLAFALAKRSREALVDFALLAGLCGLFWLSAILIWPAYLTDIIPLGNAVYSAFGRSPGLKEAVITLLPLVVASLIALRHKPLLPLAAAAIGAVACFLLQGRFWTYHLVPAIGLSVLAVLLASARSSGTARVGLVVIASVLLAINPLLGRLIYQPSVIPQGVKTVLFLGDRVPTAYPMVTECGAFNASRYPTFWTLPEPWNTGNMGVFEAEIAKANEDIRLYRPEIIFEDRFLGKLKNFSFPDHLDLSDYRTTDGGGYRFQAWLRNDLDPSIFDAPRCQ